nr:putative integron gene cassette protein [uncultured bacterium]
MMPRLPPSRVDSISNFLLICGHFYRPACHRARVFQIGAGRMKQCCKSGWTHHGRESCLMWNTMAFGCPNGEVAHPRWIKRCNMPVKW